DGNGVEVNGAIALTPPSGTMIFGNRIGTDIKGMSRLSNLGYGVAIDTATGTHVGRPGGARQARSANVKGRVRIRGNAASGNELDSNSIGTNIDGDEGLGNLGPGVLIMGAPGNLIGGKFFTDQQRNVISDNNGDGIRIVGDAASGNTIAGNYI